MRKKMITIFLVVLVSVTLVSVTLVAAGDSVVILRLKIKWGNVYGDATETQKTNFSGSATFPGQVELVKTLRFDRKDEITKVTADMIEFKSHISGRWDGLKVEWTPISLDEVMLVETQQGSVSASAEEILEAGGPIIQEIPGGREIVIELRSASDAYQISTCVQLQAMKDDLTAHYFLAKDIDCSDTVNWNDGKGFKPVGTRVIGDPSAAFRGSFDGNGHTISNLYINRPDEDYVGLFGQARNSTIMDVGLIDANITGHFAVGALAGWNNDVSIYGLITQRVYSTGTVRGDNHVGGLIGWFYDAKLKDCYSTANVAGNVYVGGLIGGVSFSHVYSSYATGDVSGSDVVGGLVGDLHGDVGWQYRGLAHDSFATGSVTGSTYVGGLFGTLTLPGLWEVENCYWNHHSGNPSTCSGNEGTPPGCTPIQDEEPYFYNHNNPPMSSWDFENVWGFADIDNDGSGDIGVSFPRLLWEEGVEVPPDKRKGDGSIF